MENCAGREAGAEKKIRKKVFLMTRQKKQKFSVVKAVKANARERVGQPKAERVIEDNPRAEKRARKHKKTLGKILAEDGQ
ncbi:MAG TPA: hypothetical protein VMU92_13890 [Acidobacteriaceae bacterium]|nr:hypothetical protein [Acidobacteriaceae bacterium]